ncbi:hypothetical protein ACP275_01G098300 [Erythranthe tilingii]
MPLLEVEPPKQLTFRFELRKRASCTIRLSNNTDQYVAFKVSTKNPDKYFCSFNYGILLPGSSCLVKGANWRIDNFWGENCKFREKVGQK